ncbi:MAG: hypothetical protein M9955_11790 [Rhizobiaceae bacterium]|nr:hypothetical protein [Rhizobiaceae bacterium]
MRIAAAIGVIAAIAATWWMKVEEARAPDAPTQIAFDQPVKVGRAVFTPRRLAIENAAPFPTAGDAGGRKLVLAGRLENATGASQIAVFGFPETLPALSSGGARFPEPEVYLDRDKARLRQLQPRIAEDISIVWNIPEGWREQDVTIEFSAEQFKLKDNLYAKASWLLPYPTGVLIARPECGA